MTLTHMLRLAAFHEAEALKCERLANFCSEQGGLTRHAVQAREDAQFHSSSAIHLRELAEAFTHFREVISPDDSRPNAARDNSSIPTNTTPPAAEESLAREGAAAGA